MFRDMRKKNREVCNEEIDEILAKGEYGVLSTISNNGYPYSVPISYVYYNKAIYVHCAKEGHKLDNIHKNSKVCFCVVGDTEVVPNKFSTKYESVIAFGEATIVEGKLKEDVLIELISKYSNAFLDEGKKYAERAKDKTNIIKIDINHITGKASR